MIYKISSKRIKKIYKNTDKFTLGNITFMKLSKSRPKLLSRVT